MGTFQLQFKLSVPVGTLQLPDSVESLEMNIVMTVQEKSKLKLAVSLRNVTGGYRKL